MVTRLTRAARLTATGFLLTAVLAGGLVWARGCPVPQHWGLDVERTLDLVGAAPGGAVGEAGAGDGYFTFPLADRVGARGVVYANDIDPRALARLDARRQREGRANIRTVLGAPDDPKFPRNDLDLIVVVHAFHDFDDPVGWLVNARKYLRPGGTLAIVDRDPERSGETHFLRRERIVQLASRAGYELVSGAEVERDHLVLVFKPAGR